MNKLDSALDLAKRGLKLFPVKHNSKVPAHKGWQEEATDDEETLRRWFGGSSTFNIGVYTGINLLVVDVDDKNGKCGSQELLSLEMAGLDLPETFEVSTPSGGRHIYLYVDVSVRGGVDVLGKGLDIRSSSGLCLGPGSQLENGEYRVHRDSRIAHAPAWLVERCGAAHNASARLDDPTQDTASLPSSLTRGRHYLRDEAELAIEGQGGDAATFRVAAHLKDLGCSRADALALMLEHWNEEKAQPPWNPDELATKVDNAFRYGDKPQGANSPEADFDVVPDSVSLTPYDKLNKEFAYTIAGDGDMILWETTNEKGNYVLKRLSKSTFHTRHAAIEIGQGKSAKPLTELWIKHKNRRSYDGIVFMPEQQSPARFFNVWRGFAVRPYKRTDSVPIEAKKAFEDFKLHLLKNVCNGDEALCKWLTGFFAHVVQKPWEKPLVALVLQGGKGTGKSIVADTIGALLGEHYRVTANPRYLTSNFNGHLENCLLFALEEASWAGNKGAEGVLKDLITGNTHLIEHKGHTPYPVDNLTRIVVLGNDEWVTPASNDERRFAVFNVGAGNQQDQKFFEGIAKGMAKGGYRLLIDYLAKIDLTGINVNSAPNTRGLLEQKIHTLEPLMQWWYECLRAETLLGGDFSHEWPTGPVTMRQITAALRDYQRGRNISSRVPSEEWIGRKLKAACPGQEKKRLTDGGYGYTFPSVEICREDWEKHMRQKMEWNE